MRPQADANRPDVRVQDHEPRQVRGDLDPLGWAAAKLRNVGRYYAQQ